MYSATDWQAVEDLFCEALEVTGVELERLLASREPRVVREVRELLSQDPDSVPILQQPLIQLLGQESAAELEGTELGDLKLDELIGEGGMAAVYRATQTTPEFQRQVAVKILHLGTSQAGGEALRGFRQESRILALLQHPGIARLLDAGVTPSGWPFLVMEYVEGCPIDRFCREARLSLRRRLELMAEVCDAVQHAHQNLVVHLDIKPRNVLVTSGDRPILLDFGIARLLGTGAEEASPQAGSGQVFLTPAYASPEQLRGELPGTGSDIYSLGVLLYELIEGRRPESLSIEGMPSVAPPIAAPDRLQRTRVALAEAPSHVLALESGNEELDALLRRALAVAPEDRYPSAGALAEEIRRYLSRRPLATLFPSKRYRARKFFQRNWQWLTPALVLALVLVASMAVIFDLLGEARNQRDRAVEEASEARHQAARSERMQAVLIDMFNMTRPERAGAATLTAEELLESGARRADQELSGEPDLHGAILQTLGLVYGKLGRWKRSEELLERALTLQRKELGDDHPEIAATLGGLGSSLLARAKFEAAEERFREALRIQEAASGPFDRRYAANLDSLGILCRLQGRHSESEDFHRRALSLREEHLGPDHRDTVLTLNHLALLNKETGHFQEAGTLLRRALAAAERMDDPEPVILSQTLANLGAVLSDAERHRDAVPFKKQALEIQKEVYGGDTYRVAVSLSDLGLSYFMGVGNEPAKPLLLEAATIKERVLGASHPSLAYTQQALGVLYLQEGRLQQAETEIEKALALREAVLGPDHLLVAQTLDSLAEVRARQGRLAEAQSLLERAQGIFRRADAPASHRAMVAESLARLDLQRDHPKRALAAFQEALRSLESGTEPRDDQLIDLSTRLSLRLAAGEALDRLGRGAEAETLWNEALRLEESLGDRTQSLQLRELHAAALCLLGREGEVAKDLAVLIAAGRVRTTDKGSFEIGFRPPVHCRREILSPTLQD